MNPNTVKTKERHLNTKYAAINPIKKQAEELSVLFTRKGNVKKD